MEKISIAMPSPRDESRRPAGAGKGTDDASYGMSCKGATKYLESQMNEKSGHSSTSSKSIHSRMKNRD